MLDSSTRAGERLNLWRPRLLTDPTNVMVGKPGPISIYEAIACRVPLVLVDNPSLRLLFEYNLSWVEQQGIGQRVQSLADIPGAVSDLLAADHWRQNMARIQVNANADVTSCLRQLIQAGKLARAAQV
jgi:UDP-N-acetylglucosamine:LPS N-acetylglucosamine transferase